MKYCNPFLYHKLFYFCKSLFTNRLYNDKVDSHVYSPFRSILHFSL